MDINTLNIERARFARVYVEVNLKKPLKGIILVNGERYFVSYEGLSNICSGCGLYGHLVSTCLRRSPEKVVTVSPVHEVMVQNQNASGSIDNGEGGLGDDGFIIVRSNNR